MREGQPTAIHREAYAAPAFWIDTVDLTFDLDPAKTRVLNKMRLRRNPDVAAQPLRLDGEDLNLARVLVNGAGTSFKMDANQLVLENLPEGTEAFDLEIFTTCNPEKNTQLMGLYVSNDSFFTQCEAEGFRRITYFLDRPDVMASYTVTLRADKAKYPVLLSNGNLLEQGTLDDGRHFAKWVDPHKKPCYLFALVAGQLVAREQRILSRSGKEHLLQVFVRPGDLDKTEHAMNSLMASVAWDEARFGLPLDLERFMIVATSDFNMGAMENKGLNIFNTKYVLANPATATDMDFGNIESVVGHEYFHNWTGNRVTCRDWFQLSLKEGLTVFRDQEFSADMMADGLDEAQADSARAVKRIEDVKVLRAAQFPEDAGPMAHPIRPDSYQEINNFYTVTVYEKGAEVIRMQHTLLGETLFQRGMKIYFDRHDGQAVTCEDFVAAMETALQESHPELDLKQFRHWYAQAGTPEVFASWKQADDRLEDLLPVLRLLLTGRHDTALDDAADRQLLKVDHRGGLAPGDLWSGQQPGVGQGGDDVCGAGWRRLVAADLDGCLAPAAHGQPQHHRPHEEHADKSHRHGQRIGAEHAPQVAAGQACARAHDHRAHQKGHDARHVEGEHHGHEALGELPERRACARGWACGLGHR